MTAAHLRPSLPELSISFLLFFFKLVMSPKPHVLIMGHAFVRRFELFLSKGIDARVRQDLNLSHSVQITFLGVGGRRRQAI